MADIHEAQRPEAVSDAKWAQEAVPPNLSVTLAARVLGADDVSVHARCRGAMPHQQGILAVAGDVEDHLFSSISLA